MTLHHAGHRVRAHGAGYRAGRGSAKPLAIVAIGGLITSTILTLFVLPPISHLLLKGRHKHHVADDYSDVDKFGAELIDK